ncbi:MAG TPA: ComEC/Rec2 family competence protein [Bacteroidia bacterium]|nr:ComEC/Rec2 family competence protein [Bacteroidia bacterium]HNU33829.1 ComEC/Rec2 family competence protein [Bacteroidia bacterium]
MTGVLIKNIDLHFQDLTYTMINFSELPMGRILLLFCTGIVASIFFPVLPIVSITTGLFALALVTLFTLVPFFYKKYKWRWVYGVFLCLLMWSVTQTYVFLYSSLNAPDHFLKHEKPSAIYLIRISESCHQKTNSYRVNAEVKGVLANKTFIKTSGEVLLTIMASDSTQIPVYGDYILTNAQPEEIPPPQNPSQFDYKEYLSFHNISSRFTLTKYNYYITDFNDAKWLLKISYSLRDKLVEQLKDFFITRDELAVASALLVGFEDYLDPEIIQAFSSTGALHVLSVSGMHVGLVFICLSWLLSFMDKKKMLLIIKYIILVSLIWFYALMTGFSPSVLRSVVMVSLVIFSKVRKRESDTLNAMLGSAFLLLCYNPFYITEVGFQLSYLAVFGIVYLHPMLAQQYVAPNKIMHWIWQLTSVSLTAQLMTFPLGLLYFHQFPLLFLISNLIIIPITTIIIYIGIGALILFFIPFVSDFLWQAGYHLTRFLNLIVKYIDSLKSLTLNGLSITVFETWLIYALIATMLGFIIYRNRKLIFASLLLSIILCVLQINEKIVQKQQQKLIVYSVPRKTAIDFISGNDHVFVADKNLIENASQLRFFVQHNWDDLGLNPAINVYPENILDNRPNLQFYYQKKGFVLFENKTVFIADKYFAPAKNIIKQQVDFLIITGNYKGKALNILDRLNPKEIIFDSSVPVYKMKKYAEELVTLKIKYKNVLKDGAVVIDL